jgi:putative transposase
VVKRRAGALGFAVHPNRWSVEGSLGWGNRVRRLSKDYEYHPETSENMSYLAAIRLMVRRLTRKHDNIAVPC